MPAHARVGLPRNLIEVCRIEVTRTFPLESGGVLMGRRIGPNEWLVDHVIGPGPRATHQRYRFSPDLDWQHEQIAAWFHATNGQSTYLGDWHSHPGARHGRLSYVDRAACRTILRSPASQCDRVLMAIVWGSPEGWDLDVWACELGVGWIWGAGVLVSHVGVTDDLANKTPSDAKPNRRTDK